MSQTLCLLPGLQLDTLTVEDCSHDGGVYDGWSDVGTYHDVSALLIQDGWKELRYSTPSTSFMTGRFDSYAVRVEQPQGWNEELRKRDIKAWDAQVQMYLAVSPRLRGLTESSITRTEWTTVPGHLAQEDNEQFEDGVEVMVYARRGVGAAYVQDGRHLNEDLRELLGRMTWEELKVSDRLLDGESDPSSHL